MGVNQLREDIDWLELYASDKGDVIRNPVAAIKAELTRTGATRLDAPESVTAEGLVARGWEKANPWPYLGCFVGTASSNRLYWRGAGLWLGEQPLCLATTYGEIYAVLAALRLEMPGAA